MARGVDEGMINEKFAEAVHAECGLRARVLTGWMVEAVVTEEWMRQGKERGSRQASTDGRKGTGGDVG